MKSLILGDVHAELRIINEWIKKYPEVAVVFQCGDLGVWKKEDLGDWPYLIDKAGHYLVTNRRAPFSDVVEGKLKFDRPLIFITGNHENFSYRDEIYLRAATSDSLYTMRADEEIICAGCSRCIDGHKEDFENKKRVVWLNKPFDIDKIKIAGLNGCYSYKVYTGGYQKRRKIKVKPETPPHIENRLNDVMGRDPRGRFKEKEVEALKKQKADILLLHEIPIGLDIKGELSIKQKPGCSPINEIIEKMQPRYAFIGHMHLAFDREIGRTKIVGVPSANVGAVILDTETWKFRRVVL